MGLTGIAFIDLERAAASHDPEFADLVIRYSSQNDPSPGLRDHEASDPAVLTPNVPSDAWTLQRIQAALHPMQFLGKDDDEQRSIRARVWEAADGSPYLPDRMQLADLLVGLYQRLPAISANRNSADLDGDHPKSAASAVWIRESLISIISGARIRWGVWGAFKRIFKLAEQRQDAEMFGAIACRVDRTAHWRSNVDHNEVRSATLGYMRRRAWRFLRLLGQSVPELFPEFAVQILRHYPASADMTYNWVANHIFDPLPQWPGSSTVGLSKLPKPEKRAFNEAWKATPAPLLFLLEAGQHTRACEFAIASLRADFPEELRSADAEWLKRIGRKKLPGIQLLIVELLQANPDFHQSKLRELGLHDMVMGFLATVEEKVASYVIEYVKAHEPTIELDSMLSLITSENHSKVTQFLLTRLQDVPPATYGLPRLLRLLQSRERVLVDLAKKKITEGFSTKDINADMFVEAYLSGSQSFLDELYEKTKTKVPTEFYLRLTEHPKLNHRTARSVLRVLSKRTGKAIGMEWFKRAVFHPLLSRTAVNWLTSGWLKDADGLDVEWVKDLTRRPTQRAFALSLLSNQEIVQPASLGVPWLLSLLRRSDPKLQTFGRESLLSAFGPEAFEGGIAGVWKLTNAKLDTGKRADPVVRRFAFDWLLTHHPGIGPTLPQSTTLGVKPKAATSDYTLDRVRPLLSESSEEARQFACHIARVELRRWNMPDLPYTLATSRHPEPRRVGTDALVRMADAIAPGNAGADEAPKGKAQDPNADLLGEAALPLAWLDADRIFAMTNSHVKATRDLAMTLIRQHYERIGSAESLTTLMVNPARDVRLFAVRLLWDLRQAGAKGSGLASAGSLARLLRTVMYTLPPGRAVRREGGAVDKPLANGEAKRRMVDVVTELAEADESFARVVMPILSEMMDSEAGGEWEACVAAIARLRKAHPEAHSDMTTASQLAAGHTDARPRRKERGL